MTADSEELRLETPVKESGRARPAGRRLLEIIETVALAALIFVVIQNFVAQPFRVEQESMQHTLEQGEYVLVDKLTPRFDSYSRGDIVVFRPPEGEGDVPFIKRVIGLPGDTVTVRDGVLSVNDQPLDEAGYVYDGQPTDARGGNRSWEVTPDHLFVLGDHRAESVDSRVFGPIPVSRVVGRAWLRYWPITTLSILQTPSYPNAP